MIQFVRVMRWHFSALDVLTLVLISLSEIPMRLAFALLLIGCSSAPPMVAEMSRSLTVGPAPGVLVDVGPGMIESSGRQVIEQDGAIYVVSIDPSPDVMHVYRSPTGSSWAEQDAAHQPNASGGSYIGGADVAPDPVGHLLHTVWLSPALGKAIYQPFSTSTNTYGAQEQVPLSIYTGDVGDTLVAIALSPARVPFLALTDRYGVVVWRRTGANAWTSDRVLTGPSSATYAEHPSMAFDSQGRLHVAWLDGNQFNGPPAVKYAQRSATGTWGSVETVESPVMTNLPGAGGGADQSPSLAVDGSDLPHVTYLTGAALKYSDSTTSQIHVRWRDSAGWHDDSPGGYCHNPSICALGGDQYVACGHDFSILPGYKFKTAGGSWSAEIPYGATKHDGSVSCTVEPGSVAGCGKILVAQHDEASTVRTGYAHAEVFFTWIQAGNCSSPSPSPSPVPDMSMPPDLSVPRDMTAPRDLATPPDLLLPLCPATCRCGP